MMCLTLTNSKADMLRRGCSGTFRTVTQVPVNFGLLFQEPKGNTSALDSGEGALGLAL